MNQNEPIHWTGPHFVGQNPTEKIWRLEVPGEATLEVSWYTAATPADHEGYVFTVQVRGSEIAMGGRLSLADAQKAARDAIIDYADALAEAGRRIVSTIIPPTPT